MACGVWPAMPLDLAAWETARSHAQSTPPRKFHRFRDTTLVQVSIHLGAQHAHCQRLSQFGKHARLATQIAGRTALHQPVRKVFSMPVPGSPHQGVTTQGQKILHRLTIPDRKQPCPLGKVNRQFRVPAPNMLWVSDLIHVATWKGFVDVAFVIDAYPISTSCRCNP